MARFPAMYFAIQVNALIFSRFRCFLENHGRLVHSEAL